MLTGLQRIQVFQIPNQHFNKLSATKLWVHSRWWWALRFCYHLWFWWEGVARVHRSDSESNSAAIYNPDGEELGRIHRLWLWLWEWGCCVGWGIWAPWWELWSCIRCWAWWLLLGWLVYSGWWRWAKIWERSMCFPKEWSWPAPKRTKENSIMSIEDYEAVCDQG